MHARPKFQRQPVMAPKQATFPVPPADSLAVAAEAFVRAAARRATMRQLIARSVLHGPALRSLLGASR